MPDLKIDGLRRVLGGKAVLDGLDLSLGERASATVVGPSGSGKSTLLNLIGALDAADGGNIRLGDVSVTGLDGVAAERYRAKSVGFVFQEHHLLKHLTALENVLLPSLAAACAGSDRATARQRAEQLLADVGLADKAASYPATLSGGERQRVAVARAIHNGPSLLLCDEPTGNLDRDTGDRVMDLLLRTAAGCGASILLVTHNMEHARRADRVYEMRGGRLVDVGK
ncbi:MAG: ABC transporter ATP-binding protein [Armatimonadetes bacterium]|nr:ABC transporter ATP-binding protein [Armatimonadota bacterium]